MYEEQFKGKFMLILGCKGLIIWNKTTFDTQKLCVALRKWYYILAIIFCKLWKLFQKQIGNLWLHTERDENKTV